MRIAFAAPRACRQKERAGIAISLLIMFGGSVRFPAGTITSKKKMKGLIDPGKKTKISLARSKER
jgi:hypothetical protein